MVLCRATCAGGLNWAGTLEDRQGLPLDQIGSFLTRLSNFIPPEMFKSQLPSDLADFLVAVSNVPDVGLLEQGKAEAAAKAAGEDKGEAEAAAKAAGEDKGEAEAAVKAAGADKGEAEAAAKAAGKDKGEAEAAAKAAGEDKGEAEAAAKAAGDDKGAVVKRQKQENDSKSEAAQQKYVSGRLAAESPVKRSDTKTSKVQDFSDNIQASFLEAHTGRQVC
jgi:hypothetical protein